MTIMIAARLNSRSAAHSSDSHFEAVFNHEKGTVDREQQQAHMGGEWSGRGPIAPPPMQPHASSIRSMGLAAPRGAWIHHLLTDNAPSPLLCHLARARQRRAATPLPRPPASSCLHEAMPFECLGPIPRPFSSSRVACGYRAVLVLWCSGATTTNPWRRYFQAAASVRRASAVAARPAAFI